MKGTQLCLSLLAALALALPSIAGAGFDEALKAYQSKEFDLAAREARTAADAGDARSNFLLGVLYQAGQGLPADPEEAIRHFEKAAQGGVLGAYAKLAQAYMRGTGVVRNHEKAAGYARQSARLGDPEGALILSLILTNQHLGYLDANGKPDDKRYWQLASRPLNDRAVDTEARDALYWAADRKHPVATMMLALSFGATVGDGNRKRMQALIDQLPNHTYPALKNYEKISRFMDTLGESYTTPQLFADTQAMQMFAAMLKTCGISRDAKDAPKPPLPKLIGLKIAKPVSEAVYLPSNVPGYERAYLLAGQWEEDWIYQGCDRTATVTVRFMADGLGGARMMSEQRGKDIPGLKQEPENKPD